MHWLSIFEEEPENKDEIWFIPRTDKAKPILGIYSKNESFDPTDRPDGSFWPNGSETNGGYAGIGYQVNSNERSAQVKYWLPYDPETSLPEVPDDNII